MRRASPTDTRGECSPMVSEPATAWREGEGKAGNLIQSIASIGVLFSGDIYEGEFIENLREGKGIMRYSNGARYEGSWRANQYEGLGTLRFGPIIVDDRLVSGRVYSGQWKGGLMHGKGLLKLGDGGEYEGMFKVRLLLMV
jgi:1-phosphatidylinositol-4-phosphate 5-kinase